MKRVAIGRLLLVACAAFAVLAACGGSQPPIGGTGLRPLSHGAGSPGKYLKHVIVIIQENRSFENFFAGYPGANAPLTACASPSPGETLAPRHASGTGCPPGDVPVTLHQDTFKNNPDLQHNWTSSMVDWNNGQMDGFSKYGTKHGKYEAYTYIDQAEIQPYWTMAGQYVLADAMFPTEFGGSFTGHLTLIAGTDDIELPGEAEVNFPSNAPDDCDSSPGTKSDYLTPNRKVHYTGPFPCFDQFNTIAQVLDSASVSWKIYATKVLDGGLWEPFEAIKYVRYGPDWPANIIAPQTKVLTDAADGNLASVNWVTPSHADSDHPGYHGDAGPSWVASVVNAVGESSYWPTSAVIVVWDDWGGFYDNAPPPQLDYRGLGIRVPCLIISPYAKQNYVSHVRYEYGSILRFVEEVYGIPAGSIGPKSMGYTDKRSASLDDAFDFTQAPRPFTPIGSKYPTPHFLHEPPSNEPVDTE
ncbi:MAG TPA: alkaline phosphatase family protein [Candidatus Dormibacteraeota bacterium]|nr:alkaline phosphatase family protein [Candidatus Dormibacteraeota bacterium]